MGGGRLAHKTGGMWEVETPVTPLPSSNVFHKTGGKWEVETPVTPLPSSNVFHKTPAQDMRQQNANRSV